MAEERDIEKQLRGYAEKRRREAGAPLEMHPATRRLLQDEVRRTHKKPAEAAERTSLFASWWFRIAAGACVVVLAAVVFLPALSKSKSRSMRLAKNLELREKAITGPAQNRPASLPPESAPAPVVSSPLLPSRDEKNQYALTGKMTAKQAAAEPSTVVATNVIASGMAVGGSTLAFAPHSAQQNFYFRNAGTPADINVAVGRTVGGQLAKSDLRQSLNDRVKAAAEKIPLASFQIEQTGNQIRITDSDGSVYNGDLTVTNAEMPNAGTPIARSDGVALAPAPAAEAERQFAQPALPNGEPSINNAVLQQNQNFRFKAAGTNLSLNQRVTISGEFIATTNLVTRWGTTLSGGDAAGANSQVTAIGSQQLSNGRIIGKAVLDNGQQILLNATPVAP
jgi:hypothetical protein